MRITGVKRKVDELGRYVIPKEFRRTLDIKAGDVVAASVIGHTIVIRKHETSCIFCGDSEMENPKEFEGKLVCEKCLEQLRG